MSEIDLRRTKLSDSEANFIAIFLRFEFALKENGFCPNEGDAMVQWYRVATELGPAFFERICTSGNAETIMSRPPKKQVARNHMLEWSAQDRPANIHQLFEAVRRVRNNLVHGGKSGDPEFDADDPQRNDKLIGEARWIIEQALCQMPTVKSSFEGFY
jgi:hypothetical protein